MRAFIFDMDGVILDGEPIWDEIKPALYAELFGDGMYAKHGPMVGLSIEQVYQRAREDGLSVTREQVEAGFHRYGPRVYHEAPITPGTDELIRELVDLDFRLGLVSASPRTWIEIVLSRLAMRDKFEVVMSLTEREDLQHKPHPDGYHEAMRRLGATPAQTMILEDSNGGIAAAKAAGAHVIGLRQNLLPGYVQEGADVYADDMEAVAGLARSFVRGRGLIV